MKAPRARALLLAAAALTVAFGSGTAAAGQAAAEGATGLADVTIVGEALPGVSARGAAILLTEGHQGEVDGAVLWTLPTPERIRVFVEVDGASLLASAGELPIEVDVFGYLVDPSGAVIQHLAEGMRIADPVVVAAVRAGGLRFVAEMPAPAGAEELRIAVCDRESGRYFSEFKPLALHQGEEHGRFLLPPTVVSGAGRWVVALGSDVDPESLRSDIRSAGGWPSALPTWRLQRTLDVVIARSAAAAGEPLAFRVLGGEGAPVAARLVDLLEVAGAPGVVVQRARVAAPDLPPGEYLLVVDVGTDREEPPLERSMPVVVHDDEQIEVWIDAGAQRAARRLPPVHIERPPAGAAERSEAEDEEAPDAAAAATLDEPAPEALCGGLQEAAEGDHRPMVAALKGMPLAGVEARGAALLFSGQSGGEVDGAVLWSTVGAAEAGARAPAMVVAEVDGRQLLAGSSVLPVPIEVYGYLIDGSGVVVGHLAEGFLLDDCTDVVEVRRGGLKFVGGIAAPPGLYSLRLLVRNRDTRRFFLARRDLEVPEPGSERPYLLPPLATDGGQWVVAGGSGPELEAFAGVLPGAGSWPSARPVWRSDKPISMVVGSTRSGAELELTAHLVEPGGAPVPDPELAVSSEASHRDGLVFRHVEVAGPDVPAGVYRLQLLLADRESGETVTQVLPVVVFEDGELAAWTDPAAPRGDMPRPLPSREGVGAAAELEAGEVSEAYKDVLRLWSRGEVIEARRRLAELERPPAGVDPARRWRQLFTEERLAILALAKDRPETILAVAMLHRDMHAWYMSRRETDLAEHSWQMSAMLARVAPSLDGLQPPPGFSECLLVDLATQLARSGQWQGARRALEAAVEVAPDSAPAQLGLGALLERTGDPKAAAEELQKLVRAHPDNLEGRLRLGVNSARLGDVDAARELYRGLLDTSTELWIRTIAYQELATLLIAEDRAGEAAQLLRAAVAAIPLNQRLRILESFALEAAGRSRESAAAVEILDVDLAQQSTSPRYRYSRWPELDEQRVRLVLGEADEMGRAALREVMP